MWIKLEALRSDGDEIYLPQKIAEKINQYVRIYFGKRVIWAQVKPSGPVDIDSGKKFDNPLKVGLTDDIIAKLMIPSSLIYQMKIFKNAIIIGPVIGLLIGNRNHVYSPRHMEKYSDRFGVYEKIGGLIYAFSPRAIDWGNNIVFGLYYNYEKQKWLYGRFPLPTVIYRRDFHTDQETVEKLVNITGKKLFNSWRFTKYFLYQYFSQSEELKGHLPPTEIPKDADQIISFIDRHEKAILKPVNLSRGRGICIVKKEEDGYKVMDYREKTPVENVYDADMLEKFFNDNKSFYNGYLIQKHIPLARVDNSVFDIRIVMQKDRKAEWQCSGIECRVAGSNSLLTNISRGGYALTLKEALNGAFPGGEDTGAMIEELGALCGKVCEDLDKIGHHYAELGLDIAVDEDKNFWIIEANVFPSFKGFKKMDQETYLNIRYTPMLYAAYLAGF